MNSLRIGLVQMRCEKGAVAENLETTARHIVEASMRGVEVLGFPEASIVLSNQLDEMTILQIISQIQAEAPIYGLDADHVIQRLVYGVGTRLITSDGDAALDGVYKLVAIKDGRQWQPPEPPLPLPGGIFQVPSMVRAKAVCHAIRALSQSAAVKVGTISLPCPSSAPTVARSGQRRVASPAR